MADEMIDGAAETASPTETGTDTADPSAGTQTNGVAPTPEPPFHLHPRWQQLQGERRQDRETIAQLTQRLQQHEARLAESQRAAQNGQVTPELREQYRQASAPLGAILAQHPEILEAALAQHPVLNRLVALANGAPQLVQGYQGVQALQARAQQEFSRTLQATVTDLATKAGLPADDNAVAYYDDLVSGAIRRDPELKQRAADGDLSVVPEAFDKVQKSLLQQLRRESNVALTQAKTNTRNLPIPARGGGPGVPAPPEFVPGKTDPKELEKSIFKRASQVIANTVTG